MSESISFPPRWGSNTPANYRGLDNLITEALEALLAPGQVVELRVLGARFRGIDGWLLSGFFDDHAALDVGAGLRGMAFARSICVTLNNFQQGFARPITNVVAPARRGGCAADDDVARIRVILLDFDPARPADVCATDSEHQAALDRAREVTRWLHELSVYASLADSGNGGHVYVHVDLPADAATKALIGRLMTVVSFTFADEQVELDMSTGNFARVVRLPGTMNRKGEDLPNRPHRRTEMLAMVPRGRVTSRRALEAIIAARSTEVA